MPEGAQATYIPLPTGLLDPGRTAGRVFDEVAAEYHASRPGYPPAAIARVAEGCGLGASSHVLEIGCGTGQLTRDIAAAGCRVRCLEPGPNLAALARQSLRSWPGVEVVTDTFEAANEAPGSYDAVISATAFHWIDPRVSYAKAATILRPGGYLALLTNAHARGGTQDVIAAGVGDLHRRIAPELGGWTFPSVDAICSQAMEGGDLAAVWARVERKLSDPPAVEDIFEPPRVSTYPWVASYDRDGYLTMLRSQSSYALMDERRRNQILQHLGALIDDQLGGQVTKQYVCIAALAAVRPR